MASQTSTPSVEQYSGKIEAATHVDFVNREGKTDAEKKLVWKQDLRIIPLSAGIFLLCYLDRSNIGGSLSVVVHRWALFAMLTRAGNAKTLNANTGNDLMTETGMSNHQYL